MEKTKAIQKPKNDIQKQNNSSSQAKKKQYKKLCFKDTIVLIKQKIGNTLLFKETENSTVIGKLVRIIPEGGNPAHPKWPMIEVQWYYKKQDLDFKKLGISDEDQTHFGYNEVFPTNHHDKIYVDCIQGKCQVHHIDDYDKLETVGANVYFTRANYNPLQKILDPPFIQWEKYCLCQKPLNPNNLYIKCDGCNQWYHPKCMGISDSDAYQTEDFFCVKCSEKQQNAKETNQIQQK